MNPTNKTEAEIAEEKLITELQAKHGKIKTVIIPLDEDDETKVLTYYFKKPDKQTRSMIDKLQKTSVERAVIAGYKALVVGGDSIDALQNNDDALLIAEHALVQILEVQKAVIKKN